jgi:K+/H+ antiporter YhaU regulatory subunit KhtT
LLPKAHNAGVPVFELEEEEIGEVGVILDGMVSKKEEFYLKFNEISSKLQEMLKDA